VKNDKLKEKYDEKVKSFIMEMAKSPQIINDYHGKNYIPKDKEAPLKLYKDFLTDRSRIV